MVAIGAGFVIAFFFAMNIGGSGAAASMGAAYGAGAVRSRRVALCICGAGVFPGAVWGGGEVVKTMGFGIIPASTLTVQIVIIILASACLSLFIANRIGIPLSTSEVTVGAVTGAGLALGKVYWLPLLQIVCFWILVPVTAYSLAWLTGRMIPAAESRWPILRRENRSRWLALLLVVTGFLEAFAAGMNNVANAVGPLVGAGLLSVSQGVLYGGFFVALGSLLLGGRVLETNGKGITDLSLLEGSLVSGTGALLVMGASFLGIPVPLTQATTSAILGVGTARNGFSLWQKSVIDRLVKVWAVSPVFSLAIAYGGVKGGVRGDFHAVIAVISVCLATWGMISLIRSVHKERSSLHEHGGGI